MREEVEEDVRGGKRVPIKVRGLQIFSKKFSSVFQVIQNLWPISGLQCTEDRIEPTCLMHWLEFWLLKTHKYKEHLVVWGNTDKQKQALYSGQMSFTNHNKIFLVKLVWLHRLLLPMRIGTYNESIFRPFWRCSWATPAWGQIWRTPQRS